MSTGVNITLIMTNNCHLTNVYSLNEFSFTAIADVIPPVEHVCNEDVLAMLHIFTGYGRIILLYFDKAGPFQITIFAWQ